MKHLKKLKEYAQKVIQNWLSLTPEELNWSKDSREEDLYNDLHIYNIERRKP